MRKKILKGIAHLCLEHPQKILLIFLTLFVIAFVLTGRLRFDPDFMKLFPAERGSIKLYLEHLKEAGTFDSLFVLLERKEETSLQTFIDSGISLAETLKNLKVSGKKAFKSVRYQKMETEDFEKAKPLLTLFLTHPYLFLDEEDISILKERWTEEAITRQVRKNRRALVSQASFAMKDLIRIDPLEMRWLFMEKWRQGLKGMEFDESSPFFLSKAGNHLLIMAEPQQPANDLSFSNLLMKQLETSLSKIKPDEVRGISVFFTGAHPIATAEARMLRFDMQSSLVLSLLLVLFLFFSVYRRWVTLLFVGLPLVGGIQLTMGIASLTLRSLNLLTSAFAAILVGLGIDFAVHLYDRYQQERASGKDISTAMVITLTETGSGIWTGALTTIFAFAILYFSRIRGIVELAFIVSVGLLCALLCITFVLPSFLIWVDRWKKTYPYRPIQTLRFKTLSSLLRRHPLAGLLALIGITLFLGFFAFKVEVEKDFRNLRPRDTQALQGLERMAKAFGGKHLEAMILLEGQDLSMLLSKEERTIRILKRYQTEGKIHSYISLSSLLPSSEKQQRIAKTIRDSMDLKKVRENFVRALTANGFEVSEFQDLLQNLESLRLGNERIFKPETLIASLEQSPLKQGMGPLFQKRKEGYRIVIPIYYQKGKLSVDQLEKELPGVWMTGAEKVESEILQLVKEDLSLLTPVSLLMIFLLVFSHFRSWKITLLTLMPLATGLVWLVGAMALLGIKINFVNAVVLPMIIGMGIDNSIHLMHRHMEGGGNDPIHALNITGRAMTMCSITTMLGFGSLITARYQALSTMGWVTILGMGFCLIASLFLLPALLLLLRGKHEQWKTD